MLENGFVPLPKGGRIAYSIHGARPDTDTDTDTGVPLLLLRPLGGSTALWDAGGFRERLATQRRVISFDPRGAGHSSSPPLGTTTRLMARDAVAVLDHLGIRRADLFGLSLGGMVASFVAADAPERVRRLVLGSTARHGFDVSRHGLRRTLSLGSCLLHSQMSDVEVCMVHRILSARFRSEHPEAVRRIEELVRHEPASRSSLLILLGAAALHSAGCALRRVRAPALLLFGAHDPLLRADSRAELASALPAAHLEIIPACGHDLSLEQPLLTADRIDSFLST